MSLHAALTEAWNAAQSELESSGQLKGLSAVQRYNRVSQKWRAELQQVMGDVEQESKLRQEAVTELESSETMPPPRR